ncbi:YncE family protein [Meiothermus sp.]|uniref:YncE family protein n=1 Tax=Meiothermus sp. TaxID=1955249 RepID=UPI002606CEB4|nr:YncE family protein [Meiothermus sp.]
MYAFTQAGMLAPAVKDFPQRVYVPDGKTNRLYVIDPKTYRIVDSYPVDAVPQHVVPSYDLKTLYVVNDVGQTLIPVDPKTAKPELRIRIADPYNLYFTPDGKYALVVAEVKQRLDFYDLQTWRHKSSISVPCKGVNHMDYSADGRTLVAACEFSGDLLKIDVAARKLLAKISLGGMPQDVKLSPDGQIFYVADMMAGGVHLIDAEKFQPMGFIPTGKGAHGLYPSRDAKYLYISNRGEGSVSVLEFATRKLVAKWKIPGGGSPDMGGVSADGKQLWLAGRYHGEVYVFDTDPKQGGLIRRIKVGKGPHGLAIYPQPGRYSLGHTGVTR